jgi:TRAP-type C4-dicarboxylate transport system substrate-binding protein
MAWRTLSKALGFKTAMAVAAATGTFMMPYPVLAETKMDFSNEYPPTSIHAEGDAFFIEQVKALTNGEVDITLHTSGSLGFKSADHFYAVADEAVQIADTLAGTLAGVDSIFLLSSLPFVADDVDEAFTLYTIARPYYEAVFEDNNQILLYASPWPASGIWSKDAVTTPDELADLKMRTYDKNGTITFKEAGAAPVNLSWADVVSQLSTGGIEAVLTSAESGVTGSFWEHLGHFSEIQYAVPLNMVHMNKEVFEGLDEATQKAVLEAAKKTDEHNWQEVRTRVAKNYDTIKEHGITLHTEMSPELSDLLSKSAQPAVAEWLEATGEDGQAIMDAFNKATQ